MNPNSSIDRSRLSGNRTSVGQRLLSSWFRTPALWSLIFLCTVTALVLVVHAANTENHHIELSETASLLVDATGRDGNEVMITVLVNAVSGTVLDANGDPISGGRSIKLIQNGNLPGTTATSDTVTGIYTFTGLTLVSGDKIAVYISGAPEKGATITLSGAADITNLDIRQNVLIVRTDSGVAITNANLKEAEGGSPDPDLTAVRSLDESNVLTLPTGSSLEIASGSTYSPGADINIGGNWLNNGTFDPGTSTVTFNGNTNQTIAGSSSTTFSALTISNTGTSPDDVVSFDGSAGATNTVVSELLIISGVFDQGTDLASSSLIVSGTARCVEVRPGATWRNRGRGDETLSCDVFNEGTIEFNAAGKPCGDDDEIQIRSSLPGTQRTWEGPGTFSMIDVDVQDQKVPGGSVLPLQILVNSGTNSLNNTGWNFNITCAGPYTWIGGTGQRWADDVNWSPLRPDAGNLSTSDELIFDGNVTPAAVVEDVQSQTNRAIRLENGVLVTLKANVGGATLTLNGDTGTDLDVPAGTLLTFAGSRPLIIELTAPGHECEVAGRVIMQDEAHKLIGANAGEITMTGADAFTTTTGFNGHPFGDGMNGSVVFQSGSTGSFNAGLDPFGGIGNSVVTFESGSTAHFRATTAFFGDTGSTYGNLILDGNQGYTFAGSTQTTILNNLQIEPGSTFLLSNSPGADLNLYGNLVDKTAIANGFSPNSRVVKFLGATQTVSKAGGGIVGFDDVLINQSPGGKVQLLSPTDINVQLNLSTADALLELNGQVLELVGTITGPGNLKGDPNAIIAVTGPGDLGTVNFVSGGRILSGLLLDRDLNGSMTLGTDLSVAGTLRLDDGKLITANTLSLGPISSVLRTNGYVIGNLQKSFGASGTGSFTFPLGTNNAYSPLDANVTANTNGTLTAKAVEGKQPNIPGANALQRYWTLNGSGITADLTFHYSTSPANDVVGNEANYKIFKYDGSLTQFAPDATGSNSASDHFATLNNVSSFSDWTLAEPFVVPSLSINPTATLAEADSGQQNMTFTVTLTPAHSQTVTVHYATADGSMNPALGGGCGGMTDYVTTTGTLTFNPTVTVQTIDVPICGDNRDEPDETLTVTLDTPTNATISQGIGTGTITDNDPMPVITINDDGVATPYPSNITVSGLTQNIASLTLTLTGFSHTFPGDVDMLLVAPNGATYVFWSDISNFPVNADFTLDDNATNPLPDSGPFTGGTFRPANYSPSDTFPGPAPLPFPPYNQAALTGAATFTSVFGGLTPAQANGTWSLYIVDDTAGDFGQITGGWSLNITEVSAPCDPAPLVTNTGDNGGVNPAQGAGTGTLRQALVDICDGGTITFDTAGTFATPQTITLSNQLTIGIDNVTIDGPDPATQRVTIDGGGTTRLFRTQSGLTATIRNLTLTGGSAPALDNYGGAIYNDHATLTLIGVTVSGNTADFGGGIYNNGSLDGSATLTIVNSTISGNTTHFGDGGGIYNFGVAGNATLNLTNSTVSGNKAKGNGGGIISAGPSGATPVTITNCTITDNRANNENDNFGQGGGLATVGGTTLTLRNSIVALNFSGASPSTTADDISGAVVPATASTHNLIGNCFNPCLLTNGVNNNQLNVSAAEIQLGLLADNGGLTFTHALLFGSIAIETGNNAYVTAPPFLNTTPIYDQRGTGFPRVVDSADSGMTQTVDIGAYEAIPTIGDIPNKTDGVEDTTITGYPFDVGDAAIGIDSITAIATTNPGLIQSITVNNPTTATPSLDIVPTPNQFGTATITVTVNKTINGHLLSMCDTFDVTFGAVNDGPTVTTTVANLTYTEGDPATAVDPGVTVTDIDSANLVGASASITANFESGQDVLAWTDNNLTDGITLGTSTAQTIVLTGTDTPANYALALRAVTFQNPSDNPSTLTRTVTFTADDGTNTGSATRNITFNATNDNPTIDSNGGGPTASVNAAENQTAVTTVTSNDPDGGPPTYSISGGADQLKFSITTGGVLAFNTPPNFEVPTDANTDGIYEVTVQVLDGNGGTDTQAISVTVTNVDDPPVVATNTGITVNEASTANIITSAMLTTTDADNTPAQLTYTVGTTPVNGTLRKSGGALGGGGTFTQADIDSNLITYDHDGTEITTDSFTFTVSDGSTPVGPATFNITITPINDAPVVSTTVANLAYTENDPPTAVDNSVTITDADSANLTGATVSITANFQSGQDVLSWVDNNAGDGITLDGSSTAQTIAFTGSGTLANYEAAVRAVTYQNTSTNPATSTRTVTFTANDGTDTGSNTRNIAVTAANNGPVNTVPGPQVTSLNTPLLFSSANANQVSVADLDAGTNAIQVTLNATNGTLTLSGTSGLSFSFSDSNGTGTGDGTDDGTMTFRGSLTDVNAALNGGSFNPTPGFSGDVTIQIISNDLGFTGGGDVLTDTDSISGTVAPTVSVQDAQAAEPVSGITDILFTVTLNAPAPAGGASVQYATADQAPAPDHAVGGATCGSPGVDYEATGLTTVSFAAGEQFQTVAVRVCSDALASESTETFLLNLSNPMDATISDGTATGTITVANTAGNLLISELRTSGPGGAEDEFVEIYNNSDSPITVPAGGNGLFKMGSDCNATPVLIGTIPADTVIPARGHFLFVGVAYSLAEYATGDATLTSDIETDRNIALFSTANLAAISTVNRLDAVGFGVNTGGACNLLREATTLPPIAGNATIEHSYFRKMCEWIQGQGCTVPGIPKDTNNNANDFWLADTAGSAITGRLGAPGPENIASPIRRDNAGINMVVLDGTVGASVAPNRDRNSGDPAGLFGSMKLRYRVTNNTGVPVTRLRYRIVDMSTAIQPAGPTADLRALTSSVESVGPVNDTVTCATNPPPPSNQAAPCTVTVTGTTLEQPPNQAIGGGYNSTLSSDTVTITPLPNGQSILIHFKFGVQKTGTFRFYIIVEALP